ncbi:DUF3619 family protein [Variovorax ginsengisoli]|uniref:DUF3619 family protein n=1 Tax=Variovorax ginsengisoli TaxID=363844 RepID=A0ABT8SHY1_9BURK|nr:DUF3619 family protein [Variovorax ginsengisoli]MDN8618452.1 DUF3619 family protein [Variovorax ginsengisoli]MDO1537622.1 DUF3619 family protein [Variovorax ginsengisoli]
MELAKSTRSRASAARRDDPWASDERSFDEFGRAIAIWLSDGEAALSHDVTQRLQAARFRAIAARKPELQRARPPMARPGFLTFLQGSQPWLRIGIVAPLVVLVVGLALIKGEVDETAARLEAEVDAQLLTDVLPPTAYIDAGFHEFLRATQRRMNMQPESPKPSPAQSHARPV